MNEHPKILAIEIYQNVSVPDSVKSDSLEKRILNESKIEFMTSECRNTGCSILLDPHQKIKYGFQSG